MRQIRPAIKIDRFDITNLNACKKIIGKRKPDYLFHLAAFASVGQSFAEGEKVFEVNVNGTGNILKAVCGKKWLRKIICVSSSDIYGPIKKADLPLKPTQLFNPVSPYAQSKAAAEYLIKVYGENYGIPITVVRPFNHTGPRQCANFVIPAFCNKIIKAEISGGKTPVSVGNLDARRDISDVRDIVRGYRMIAERGTVGETYHLCSGKAFRIGDLLKKLISFSDINIKVQKDIKLLRKTDIPVLRGSYFKTRKETGWKPEITIDKTLRDSLDYRRKASQ